MFLLYVQDKNVTIRENCLDILLSTLQNYLRMDNNQKRLKDIVSEIIEVVSTFKLEKHEKFLKFLECLTKLD